MSLESVILANAALVDEDGEQTTATVLTLTPYLKSALERIYRTQGGYTLRLTISGVTGTISVAYSKMQGSFDGTNYVDVQSFSDRTVTANGELTPVHIAKPLHVYDKIRLFGTNNGILAEATNDYNILAVLTG